MDTPLFVQDRTEWRAWLSCHFDTDQEVWLAFPNKASGKPGMSYNDAVEEALCFGWIDSTVRKLDDTYRIQRFTPRNPKSTYSQPNIERLRRLKQRGLLHPSVLSAADAVLNKVFVFPQDILEILEQDSLVWEHYLQFTEIYRRIRIAYIDDARKRPEEFEKRLANFIKKTRENKLIGYGGIDQYYGAADMAEEEYPEERTPAGFFADYPAAMPLFEAVRSWLLALGPMTMTVQKTQISFGTDRKFAWVWLPQRLTKNRPEHCIVLTFGLRKHIVDKRIAEAVEPRPGRWTHHVIIETEADLDDVVKTWLEEAYLGSFVRHPA